MNNKIRNIVVTVTFSLFIAFFAVLCVLRIFSPVEYSDVEKRPLAQFPTNITVESILNTKEEDKSTIKQFEKFTVDQFPFREFFRRLEAQFQLNVLNLKENHGYVQENGSIAELETTFFEKGLNGALGRLQYIYDKYLKDSSGDKYVCLVPDKNYFLGRDFGYPVRDYNWLTGKLQAALPDMTYIDITGDLTLDDYYLTDWHWSQDGLLGVQNTITEALGSADRFETPFKENVLEGFKGGYTDQSALYPAPEKLVYLTNDILDACTVYDYETNKTYGLYNHELFSSKVPYDFFLSGTRALLRIDNPNATTDEELIVFRDSFGSSLIPLLSEGYKSIYVVDIRYVMSDMVGNLIGGYEDRDVLFLYSATILDQNVFK